MKRGGAGIASIVATVMVAGCGARAAGEDAATPDAKVPLATRDVDILFVIDNSDGMAEEQEALAAAAGRFFEVLGASSGQRSWLPSIPRA